MKFIGGRLRRTRKSKTGKSVKWRDTFFCVCVGECRIGNV